SPSPAPRYHLSGRAGTLAVKGRDLAQQLAVLALVPQLDLRVCPAQHAVLVDQEIRAFREELVRQQDVVGARHVALEVRQQVHAQVVLRLELFQRGHRVHADGQYRGAGAREAIEVV